MGRGQQQEFSVASEIRASGNPFYRALGWLLEKRGSGTFAEETCRELCAENREHPGIHPG